MEKYLPAFVKEWLKSHLNIRYKDGIIQLCWDDDVWSEAVKETANIGKKCVFYWHDVQTSGVIVGYALGCYHVKANGAIIAVHTDQVTIVN